MAGVAAVVDLHDARLCGVVAGGLHAVERRRPRRLTGPSMPPAPGALTLGLPAAALTVVEAVAEARQAAQRHAHEHQPEDHRERRGLEARRRRDQRGTDQDRQRDPDGQRERGVLVVGEEHARDVEHEDRDDRDRQQRDEEREQHPRLERRVLRRAAGTEVVALDQLGESFARSLAGSLVQGGGVAHLLSPISVSSRSISSSPCRGVFARSSSEAQRKNTTAMIPHSRSPAPIFMISPAVC